MRGKPTTNQKPRHPKTMITMEFTNAWRSVRKTYLAALKRKVLSSAISSTVDTEDVDDSDDESLSSLNMLFWLRSPLLCCLEYGAPDELKRTASEKVEVPVSTDCCC